MKSASAVERGFSSASLFSGADMSIVLLFTQKLGGGMKMDVGEQEQQESSVSSDVQPGSPSRYRNLPSGAEKTQSQSHKI